MALLAGSVEDCLLRVGEDELERPALWSSCGSMIPAVRLDAFVAAFHDRDTMAWAFPPSPDSQLAWWLEGVGEGIARAMVHDCPPYPFRGCTDVAVELGLPGDLQPCNDRCQARCTVEDTLGRGTPEETRQAVPPCLEVCPSGVCPGNTDAGLAYTAGHPSLLEPELPVPACWQVTHATECTDSRWSRLVVSRREAAEPRTITSVTCEAVTPVEHHCTDGLDNDEDCLSDDEDPDCQGGSG